MGSHHSVPKDLAISPIGTLPPLVSITIKVIRIHQVGKSVCPAIIAWDGSQISQGESVSEIAVVIVARKAPRCAGLGKICVVWREERFPGFWEGIKACWGRRWTSSEGSRPYDKYQRDEIRQLWKHSHEINRFVINASSGERQKWRERDSPASIT